MKTCEAIGQRNTSHRVTGGDLPAVFAQQRHADSRQLSATHRETTAARCHISTKIIKALVQNSLLVSNDRVVV